MNTAPKQAESIPAVTAPVRLPKLVRSRASFIANVVAGGVLVALDVVLLVWAVSIR